jgi:hypothetical protein
MQYLYSSTYLCVGGYLMASECDCSCTKLSLVQIMFMNQDIRRDVEADCSQSVSKKLEICFSLFAGLHYCMLLPMTYLYINTIIFVSIISKE